MELAEVMRELEAQGTEQTKRTYRNHGTPEPLFGVTIRDMKPLAKRIKKDQALAMELYATGNYDAAYLAGMIAEPKKMSESDFELWISTANSHMMSDYVVAVTLAETDFAQRVADRWMESGEERRQSAGWSCYCWLLGVRADDQFDKDKLSGMLRRVVREIHSQSNWVKYAMNDFVIAVGISYLPLHEEAVRAAREIGPVAVDMGKTACKTPLASDYIQRAADKNRLGFKRKNVRC